MKAFIDPYPPFFKQMDYLAEDYRCYVGESSLAKD
jgi:hypothetical protein